MWRRLVRYYCVLGNKLRLSWEKTRERKTTTSAAESWNYLPVLAEKPSLLTDWLRRFTEVRRNLQNARADILEAKKKKRTVLGVFEISTPQPIRRALGLSARAGC